MKKYILLIITIIACVSSCNIKPIDNFKCITLKVNLKGDTVKFGDLFSKMEIIPLETLDSCLIMNIEKIELHNNQLFIFDNLRPALYVFDKKGKYIKQIGKKGEGPDEFQVITDVFIDKTRNVILFLSHFGSVLIYDIEGNYIGREMLPIKNNYYSIATTENNNWVLWSCVDADESGITVVNKDSMLPIYETWHNDRMLDMGLMKPFYQYNKIYFFSSAYQNTVYQIKTDSLISAYKWDFNKDNIKSGMLEAYSKIKNGSKRNNKILKDLEEGILPYSMERHNQNEQYYYVALRKGVGIDRPWINVFYRKKDHSTFVFEQIEEGVSIRPILFTNEDIISTLLPEDSFSYKKMLPQNEYEKIVSRNSDDNPCLVKLSFK